MWGKEGTEYVKKVGVCSPSRPKAIRENAYRVPIDCCRCFRFKLPSELLEIRFKNLCSGQKLPPWCTRFSTAVHRRTLARLLTLPTYQVAEGFALPAATASFSLRFTVPLSAAEHFRLLALGCGTACHRRSRRHHL